jgi:hypothetical protein
MSDINLDFTVANNNINFTVEPNDITFTPTDIQLTFNTSSQLNAGGSNTQVQYNNGDLLAGSSTFTFNNTSNVVTITNGVIANANIQNGIINASNITSAFTNLGNVGNVRITGGVNGYVLQTDGTGNLDWAAAGGGGGNGTPGGSNTQIQYNDSGVFGGNTGFTFNEVSGNVNIPGNLSIAGTLSAIVAIANFANFAGNVTNSAQPNITSVGTLVNLSVSGNVTASNANLGNAVTSNFFIGAGNNLSNIQGSNITGNVTSAITANFANYAGNVTVSAQPNITSLGTLTDLSVSGNANVGLLTSIGNITTTGTTSIQQAKEKVTVSATPATGTINFDILTQAILLNTANATGNFTLNIRGNSTVTLNTVMNSNESVTFTFVNPNGANAYYATSVAVDGSTRTVKWVQPAGAPASGTIAGTDVYNLNLIKTASNTYTIFGSRLGYV